MKQLQLNLFKAEFAKLKTAVADMVFAADEPSELASLCRTGNMAFLRHKDGLGGLCLRCGTKTPRIGFTSVSRPA